MDDALELLSPYGPDLANGLTSHAPMAAEALHAMGRPDAVLPWLERYRTGMLPRPPARERIERERWRAALARADRTADWTAFFEEELREAPWREVVNRWTDLLAPGICASAAHGVIRTGHAARSLAAAETPLRLRELADGLGYWAANYQELPTNLTAVTSVAPPRQAILQVELQPQALRRFSGTIVSSLAGLDDFPEFATVIGYLDVDADPGRLVHELTEVFARVFLANAHDVLTAIVFVHGVTGLTAAANLLPSLAPDTARRALRFAWQASCGLYAAFGTRVVGFEDIAPPREDTETLADMAVANGDEHAIKFAEACLSQHRLAPSPAYPAAVRRALELLPPA